MLWIQVLNIIKGAWLAVGPLVGVLIGAYVSTRFQKRHWIVDNKRADSD